MKTDTEKPNTEIEAKGGEVSNSKNGVVSTRSLWGTVLLMAITASAMLIFGGISTETFAAAIWFPPITACIATIFSS